MDNLEGELYKLRELVWCMKKDIAYIQANCCTTPPTPPVCNKPVITAQPTSYSGSVNDNVTFTVVSTGDAPLSYQWYKNGALITNAINASYSIAGAQAGDNGNYFVTITNLCGIKNSNNATLVVTVPISHFTGYWGYIDDISTITDLSDIQALQHTSTTLIHGQNQSISFTDNSSPKILVYFEPVAEPLKTKWFGSVLNQGSIGGDSDLFAVLTSISGWRGYYTHYPTQQTSTPIIFEIS